MTAQLIKYYPIKQYFSLLSINKQNHKQYMQPKTQESKDLQKRFQLLYVDPKTKKKVESNSQIQNQLIINPKQLINIIRFVQSANLDTQISTFRRINSIIKQFALNTVVVFELGKMILPNNKVENLFDYVIISIMENQQKTKNQVLKKQLFQCFDLILSLNNISLDSIKRINQTITKLYFDNTLTSNCLGSAIQLIQKIYRTGLLQAKKYRFPFMYFLGNRDQIKVVLTNNKWNFIKGFRIALWFYLENMGQQVKKEITIMSLKTEDRKQLRLQIRNKYELYFIACKNEKQFEQKLIGNIQIQKWTFVELNFFLSGGFIFSGYEYKLNTKINDVVQKLNITIPKFSSSDIITELIFFQNFVGRCNTVLISNRLEKDIQLIELEKYKNGICSDENIESLINQSLQKKQNLFILYTPCRFYEQILLNCSNQFNNGMFSGYVSQLNTLDFRWINHVNQLLPYYYMIRFIKQKKIQFFKKLFDLTIEIILENPYQKSLLIIAYLIIEDNSAGINQEILESFAKLKANQKYDKLITLILSNFNLEKIVQHKIKIPESIQLNIGMPKIDFYTQVKDLWKKLWNNSQSFDGFWMHPQFKSQNNKDLNVKDYIYSPKNIDICKWGISNFITKQFCRPLLQPYFSQPAHVKQSIPIELASSSNNEAMIQLLRQQQRNKEINLLNIVSKRDMLKKLISKSPTKLESQKVENKIKDYKTQCLFITNLYVVCGILQIIQEGYIIFLSNHKEKVFDHMCIQTWKSKDTIMYKWKINNISKIKKRRFNQDKNSIEIIFKDSSSFVFYFFLKDCEKFLSKLGNVKIYKVPLQHFTQSKKPYDWIDRKISNFYYLMWLNYVAGRSYQDLTQYPVIPWIITNFLQNLNIQSNQIYRDLSKNMGSLGTQQRKKQFEQKYSLKNQQQLIAQYHYGTHYSSSAIICNFLIRLKPYADGAMSFQSGKFDVADRVFSNYQESWINALTSASDVRQLIPEFFVLPQMFLNINNYDYGFTQSKERIDNVILPSWAKNNPYLFVTLCRRAFQSEQVSKNINLWIDLIFGQKQRGKQAIQNMNIFYPLTYEDSIDLTTVDDDNQRISFQSQIAHFGQTPSQIIPSNAHPKRGESTFKLLNKLISDGGQFRIFKNMDKEKEEKIKGQVKIFGLNIQSKISILKIKFFKSNMYAIFKKKELLIYKIEKNEKKNEDLLITKQKSIKLQLENHIYQFDIKHVQNTLPIEFHNQRFLIGGFFRGYIFILFYQELKKNQYIKLADDTITFIRSHKNKIFCGTSMGQLLIYLCQTQFNFKLVDQKYHHTNKINDIQVVNRERMLCTCGDDGKIFIYNLYSYKLLRNLVNPNHSPILYVRISSTPLFIIIFFSKGDKKIYSYSLNGQYINSIEQQSGNIYDPKIIRSSQQFDTLVYINSDKSIQIEDLPFIELKRKIQLKKNETSKLFVFECSPDAKVGIVGTVEGGVYIVNQAESS